MIRMIFMEVLQIYGAQHGVLMISTTQILALRCMSSILVLLQPMQELIMLKSQLMFYMRNPTEMHYFKKLLKVCNKFGYRFMKPYAIDSLLWRSRYDELLETEIWKITKQILLKVKESEPDGFICYFCDELVNPQTSCSTKRCILSW